MASIRDAIINDAASVARIYNHYITNDVATFEEAQLPVEEMARRISVTTGGGWPWLVAERDGAVVGYAYASQWKQRAAYRHSAETTVYLDPSAAGVGLGYQLSIALLDALRSKGGIHAVIAGIALPNEASVRLHEKIGMRKVAHFERVGFKFDRWIDVGYWQMLL